MQLMIANQLNIAASIRADSYSTANAATLDGTGVDIGAAEGPILVTVDAALASSGETMDFAVQHSYDNVTFTNIPADALVDPATGEAATFTQNTAAVAVFQTRAVKRDRVRRYLRVQGSALGNGTPTYKVAAQITFTKKYAT